jgi:hypothetical protein
MKKKTEIPSNNPEKGPMDKKGAQRPPKNTRGEIKKKTTEYINPNNGPRQRSRKKSLF